MKNKIDLFRLKERRKAGFSRALKKSLKLLNDVIEFTENSKATETKDISEELDRFESRYKDLKDG